MNKIGLGIVLFLGVTLLLGCISRPAVPTIPPQPTDSVVIVVVTATSQPTLEATDTPEPSITPIPTLTPIQSATLTRTIQTATPLPPPTRAATTVRTTAATAVPATAAPAITPTSRALIGGATTVPATPQTTGVKYAAPVALRPSKDQRDRVNSGSDIEFRFESVGPLGSDECYLVHIDMINPNATSGGIAGDDFVSPDVSLCGDQSGQGAPLKLTIFRPTFRNRPNYGSIVAVETIAPTDVLTVRWYIRVVKYDASQADPVHNTTPLSPKSPTLEFDMGV